MSHTSHLQANIESLRACLREPGPGVSICCISGPGGVGKSYLWNDVLRELESETKGFLKLTVDGGPENTRADFASFAERLSPTSLPAPAGPNFDYFPNVRAVLATHRTIMAKVHARLEQTQGAPGEVRSIVNVLLKAGKTVNKSLPLSKQIVDLDTLGIKEAEVDDLLNATWDLSRQLHQARWQFLPSVIRDHVGLSMEDRVYENLQAEVAKALHSDLCAAVHRYLEQERFSSVKHEPIPGIDKLLLVLDDYEALEPLVDEFLRSHLLPLLKDAPFATVVVVVSRDDIKHRDAGWEKDWSSRFKARITLEAWSRERAKGYLISQGVPETEHERMLAAAEGMPFLLCLIAEEFAEGNQETAVLLKVFYERTTRWLTEREKAWFEQLVYLDEINEDTLTVLFDEADEVKRVFAWFKQEASLRDPRATRFIIRPLIRSKVLRYLDLCSPSRHRTLVAKVATAFTGGEAVTHP